MSNSEDPPSLLDILREAKVAREKLTNAAEDGMNSLSQNLRLALTAMVDDPTHPLTEGEFVVAIQAFRKLSEKTSQHLSPLGISQKVVLAHFRQFLDWYEQFIEDNAKCTCGQCRD